PPRSPFAQPALLDEVLRLLFVRARLDDELPSLFFERLTFDENLNGVLPDVVDLQFVRPRLLEQQRRLPFMLGGPAGRRSGFNLMLRSLLRGLRGICLVLRRGVRAPSNVSVSVCHPAPS